MKTQEVVNLIWNKNMNNKEYEGYEGKDICSICGKVQPANTMADINSVEFDLVCKKCQPNRYRKNGEPKYNDISK